MNQNNNKKMALMLAATMASGIFVGPINSVYANGIENSDVNTISITDKLNRNVENIIEDAVNKVNGEIEYDAPVTLMKNGSNRESMAKDSIEKTAHIKEKDGKTTVTMVFKPISFFLTTGKLTDMSVNDKPVEVLERDNENKPTKVSFEVDGNPERIVATIKTDLIFLSSQKVDIAIDWNNKTNVKKVEDKKEDIVENSNEIPLEENSGIRTEEVDAVLNPSEDNRIPVEEVIEAVNIPETNSELENYLVNKDNVKKYKAPVKMIKHQGTDESMANGVIEKTADIVEENGKTKVTMVFKPLRIQSLEGHLLKMSVNGKEVEVLERDDKNNPTKVSFEVDGNPEKIVATVEVDVMNQIAHGSAPQNVDIVINWQGKTEEKTTEDDSVPANTENSKTELEKIINEVQGFNKEKYTSENLKDLNLEKAIEIKNKQDATKEEINSAREDLENAFNTLKSLNINEESKIKAYEVADVALVKSQHYDITSMSSATIVNEGKILRDSEGNTTLLLYFKPAVINGILAYATDLKLNGLQTEFILKEDNSAVCVIKGIELDNNGKVIEGHIYSSVMDADVALKVENVRENSNLEEQFNEKLNEAEKILREKTLYEDFREELTRVIDESKKSENKVEAFINLEKVMGSIREKKANPFEGNNLFHLKVNDTSVLGQKIINKYAKVEVSENNEINVTVKYGTEEDFSGEVYFKNIEVLDEGGKVIPSEYKLDAEHNGTLKFKMPYIPAAGIFKTRVTTVNNKVVESDLQFNFKTIQPGVFRQELIEEISKLSHYKDDERKLKNLEEIKANFTEKSWTKFTEILKKSESDLKKLDLTQDEIEKNIENLKIARKNLVFKVKIGHGDNVNLSTKGLNNPNNYYEDGFREVERDLVVKWSGSKIVFGKNNDVYRVLDKGENTGKILLMAEDLRVKSPFTNDKVTDISQAVRYDKSILRNYLNNDFYNNNFWNIEKTLIQETTNETTDISNQYGSFIEDRNGFKTEDKVFAPSYAMLKNPSYGYASIDGRYTLNPYSLRNLVFNPDDDEEFNIIGVNILGRLNKKYELNSEDLQTPPCMYIDGSKILFTIDKNINLNNSLKNVEKTENNIWKLVVKDDGLNLNVNNISLSGNKVNLNYSGENLKGKNLIALIVTNGDLENGQLKAIGKVGNLNNSGEIEFNINNFDKTVNKLYVMAAENKEEGTIAASNITEIDMSKRALNKTELLSKIEDSKQIDKSKYTEESVNVLESEIKKAELIKEKADATQSEIDNVVNSLSSAITNLKLDSNKVKVEYIAPVKMLKYNEEADSMSNGAIEKTAHIIEENGKTKVIMVFKPLTIQSLKGHLLRMSVNGKEAEVLERDENNNPTKVAFEVKGNPEKIKASVEVDVMNQLAGGVSAPQDVHIVINWQEKKVVEEGTKPVPTEETTAPKEETPAPKEENNIENIENAGNKKSLTLLVEICKNVSEKGFEKEYYNKLKDAINFADKSLDSNKNLDVAFIKLLDAYKTLNTIGRINSNSTNNESKDTDLIEVPIRIKHYSQNSDSMSNKAVYKSIFVKEENGKYICKIYFKSLSLRGLEGNIIDFNIGNGNVKSIKGLNNVYKDGYEFVLDSKEKEVVVSLEADVMNMLNGGNRSPQKARLQISWDLAKLAKNLPIVTELENNEVNKKSLKSAIDEAEALARDKYTKDSIKDLERALDKAKEIYKDDKATEKDVERVKDDLNKAIKDLVKINSDDSKQGEIAVPITIKNASQKSKDSMANRAVKPKIYVTENKEKNEATYRIYFKPMKLQGMEGRIQNLYVYNGSSKEKASRISGDKEYTAGFEFTRKTLREDEIRIAVDVDVMNELGAGAQDAIISLDWKNVEVLKDQKVNNANSKTLIDRSPKKASYIKGYGDGTFKPNANITRAEVASIISNLIKEEPDKKVYLSDVNSNAWYSDAVTKLASFGVIKGYKDNTFKPEQEMTRAEVAVIIANILKLSSNNTTFKDTNNHWAKSSIEALKENNIINGYGNGKFNPDSKITRAEIVAMTNRAFNIIADENKKTEIANNKVVFSDVLPGSWFYKDIIIAK